MKNTQLIMGMPITVEIVDAASPEIFSEVFAYFRRVDEIFSTYKETSEISRINRDEIRPAQYSSEVTEVLKLCQETNIQTEGFFDIHTPQGNIDPAGLVKGWAIWKAADMLKLRGFESFYVEAGGDIQPHGKNGEGERWRVGIKNPFNPKEIIKVVHLTDQGIATSGTYERGEHIYNPKNRGTIIDGIAGITVIGPNVYEADRFATAAFAMGKKGIEFIENRLGLEGYMVDKEGMATMTSGFDKYVNQN